MKSGLEKVISESKDLASTHPEKLEELQSAIAEWEKGTQPAHWIRQDARTQASAATGKGTPAAGGRMQSALIAADKNGDGKLSRDEFPQSAIFKDIDRDNDGFATREEIQAYYAARRNPGAPKP